MCLRFVTQVSGFDRASSRCAEFQMVKSINSRHTPLLGKEVIHFSWCNGSIRERELHMMGSSSSQLQRQCLTKGCSSREMSHLYPIHHLSTEVIQVGVMELVQDLRNTRTPIPLIGAHSSLGASLKTLGAITIFLGTCSLLQTTYHGLWSQQQ